MNLLFYIINVVITYGVGVLGWYGKTNSEVSAEYPTLLTPVGWAFSIWAVIFIAQGVWVGQQFLCKLPNRAGSVGLFEKKGDKTTTPRA